MRQRWGLTQAELAALLNLHLNTVSLWERGLRTPPHHLDILLAHAATLAARHKSLKRRKRTAKRLARARARLAELEREIDGPRHW